MIAQTIVGGDDQLVGCYGREIGINIEIGINHDNFSVAGNGAPLWHRDCDGNRNLDLTSLSLLPSAQGVNICVNFGYKPLSHKDLAVVLACLAL